MEFIADLHLHSKYSRATSQNMDLETLDKVAQEKGIKILGTGDFTHPLWLKELKEKLEPAEPGLFKLKNSKSKTRFLLTTEVSCVYSKKGKLRKIHHLLLAPSFEAVEKINAKLGWIGNLNSDGRPTLGADSKEILKIVLEADQDALLIPSHAWTPWFGIFGSKSGFDSIEECFEELSGNIFTIETGLSSDPPMNWRLSRLDKITLISNSDAHSPYKIGREANVFEGEKIDYYLIVKAIKRKESLLKLIYTIEFYPEEGKYHFDGHRNCAIRTSPKETKKYNGICPVCKKPLTIGVLSRVEQLADRPEGFVPQNAIPFKSLIPLKEIIAQILKENPNSKAVEREYQNLLEKVGPELEILLKASQKEIEENSLPEIAQGILLAREGKVFKEPGFDGVYGKISVFEEKEKKSLRQETLF